MNILQPGQFYKICVAFPLELAQDSPLKVHSLPMEDSSLKGTPIRCEDTSMWHIPNKIAKPHSCYLVSYDVSTSIGVIFLMSSSPQAYSHPFVNVHSTRDSSPPPTNSLGTLPPNGFPTSFLLNIAHPLRVKLVYIGAGAFLNNVKHLPIPFGPLSSVGIIEYCQHQSFFYNRPIRLNLESEDVFWTLHKIYYKAKRGRNFKIDGGWNGGGNGEQSDGNNNEQSDGNNNDEQSGVGPNCGPMGDGSTNISKNGRGVTYSGSIPDAHWGKIGGFRIGIDIPLVTEEMDSDFEYSDEELDEDFDVIDGVVYVQDYLPSEIQV
jgi:hypothetical protein